MEPGVDANGWFDWYKALTPLAPGVYELSSTFVRR